MRKSSATFGVTLITTAILVASSNTASAQWPTSGWLNKATGGRVTTPRPFQQMNPFQARPAPTSSLPAVSEPYIDRRTGTVYGYRSNTGPQNAVGKAKPVTIDGRTHWVHPNFKPVPAFGNTPNFNPNANINLNAGTQRKSLYSIKNNGAIYRGGQQVGKAENSIEGGT